MELIPAPRPEGFRTSLAQSYDAAAARRDEMGEADWRWPIAERFLGLMRDEGKTSLIEVGAGVGYTSLWFAERGVAVVATDLSPAQVEIARGKGLDAHVRDMYDLGFAPESFDALWAMNCIHHVPSSDLDAVLQGFSEILAPGGLVYLGVWGGRDEEGIYEDDFYPPPRFFCLRSDDTLRSAVERRFTIVDFATFLPDVDKDDDGLHMQSVIAHRRR